MIRLIVGLGNPGREYEGTRHNVGFRVADLLARRWSIDYKKKRRFSAEVAEARRGSEVLVLVKPLTYMNLSGEAVAVVREWHKCRPSDVIVVYDDADLGLGRIRVRGKGSSGGHNGMQSVIEALGTDEVARIKLGIGRSEGARDGLRDHVLSRFSAVEEKVVDEMVACAAAAVESWVDRGLAATMNAFNTKKGESGSPEAREK